MAANVTEYRMPTEVFRRIRRYLDTEEFFSVQHR